MDRRAFLTMSGTALASLYAPRRTAKPADRLVRRSVQGADLLLVGAVVYDGSGAAPFEGDVAVRGDRIVAVGSSVTAPGAKRLDLRGLALAPGFIDIHSHTDLELLVDPRAQSKIRQGVTTEVTGQDGSSIGPWRPERLERERERYRAEYGIDLEFEDLGNFLNSVEQRGSSVNLATMVGHGTVRAFVIGEEDRPATSDELDAMRAAVSASLGAGACGLSSGLEYLPGAFASLRELVALAEILRGTGLPYASHMRSEDDGLLAAVEEALNVGRLAGVPVQISHLKAQGRRNWWKAEPVLKTLEAARADGLDVTYDRYPYVAYSTGLSSLFPVWARSGGTDQFLERLADPEQASRIEREVLEKVALLGDWDAVQVTSTNSDDLDWAEGRRLGTLARERDTEPYALLLEISRRDRNRTGMVGFAMSEENTGRFLSHPLGMVCSDGAALAVEGPLARGMPHPRSFGTFPRVLGRYCRDLGLMPLETGVHKMTAMPARRLRLPDRGEIREGAFADLVAFDPDTVSDRATFERPHQYPDGIRHVWVNGHLVISDGEHTGALPGRALRPGAA